MRPILTTSISALLIFASGCAPAPPPASSSIDESAPSAATPPAPDDGDCNFDTPLVPGIPGSPGHLIVSARNPNGDSELSHLMRIYVDDLIEARASLQAGAAVAALYATHRRMRCAWTTVPEQRNETYDALACAYLDDVRAYDAQPSKASYNALVQGCIACHAVTCSGPLGFLEDLAWE